MHSKMVAGIDTAVDALAGEVLNDPTLGADLVELFRVAARLDAEISRRLAAFDASHCATGDGAASAAAWLRWKCRLAPAAARERVVVARELTKLPATAADLSTGAISYRHAALIAKTTTELPGPDTTSAESILLDAARRYDPAVLGRVTSRLRYAIDPDGAQLADEHWHDRRQFFCSPVLDGRFALDGGLDAEGGATLLAALSAVELPIPGDRRTPSQRRADALVELARRSLDYGALPDSGGERPHLTVTVDLATLTGSPGSAEIDWAGPVSGDTARRLACDAGVSRVITCGASEPLDVGRRTRVVPVAIRRALVVRDKGCRFPGCDRPPVWTDAHHLRHWADGGSTCLANLVLICRFHHRLLHEGGWQLVGDPNDEVVAVRPDGTEVRPPPDSWLPIVAMAG